jgi:hypothetical protein
MKWLSVGERVASVKDPERTGVVVRVYEYPSLTVKQWVDVKWDKPVMPDQFGDTSSVPMDSLRLA